MDLKKVIIIVVSTFAATIIFLACLHVMLEPQEDEGVFTGIGNKVVVSNFGETNTKSRDMLNEIQNTEAPMVLYNETIYSTGEEVSIKGLLRIKPPGESLYVSGETENGFSVIVLDVMDKDGNSIDPISEEEGNESDELASKAFYNQKEETVIFNEKGVYRISIKVFGENGRYVIKEIKVPVED